MEKIPSPSERPIALDAFFCHSSPRVTFLYVLLLSGALAAVQCLLGGAAPIFCLPSYALAAAAAVLAMLSLRRRISKPYATALWSALLFAGYILARAHFSPLASLSHSDLLEAAACLLVYFLTALYLTEARHRLWIVAVLFLVAVVHTGVGIIQFGKNPAFMLFGFLRENGARASGMFVNPNHFAFYLETVAILAVSICAWGRWPTTAKFFVGYIAIACYAGVVVSGSRGGYISCGASLLAFAAATTWIVGVINHRRRYAAFVISALLLMVVAAIAGNLVNQSQFLSDRVEKIRPGDDRACYWKAAIDQFHLSPWIGTGSGTYLLYGRLFRDPHVQTDPVHAHNDYLEFLAEYGAVGAALAGIFLVSHLVSGLRGARKIATHRLQPGLRGAKSDALALTLGAEAAVAALLSHSAVDFNMHMPANALLFAFLFGILANPGAERPTEAPAWLSLTTLLRFAVPLGGAAWLALFLPEIKSAHLSEQARIALRNGDYHQTINLAAAAAAIDPGNPANFFYLGEANRASAMQTPVRPIQIALFEQAAQDYHEAIRRFPDENFFLRLGQALDGIGEFTDADQAYRDAIRQDPGLGILYGFYGAHLKLLGAGSATGARHCYEAAEKLGGQQAIDAGSAEAHYLLKIYETD